MQIPYQVLGIGLPVSDVFAVVLDELASAREGLVRAVLAEDFADGCCRRRRAGPQMYMISTKASEMEVCQFTLRVLVCPHSE
jgi:hypothetical protein